MGLRWKRGLWWKWRHDGKRRHGWRGKHDGLHDGQGWNGGKQRRPHGWRWRHDRHDAKDGWRWKMWLWWKRQLRPVLMRLHALSFTNDDHTVSLHERSLSLRARGVSLVELPVHAAS